MKYDLFYVLVGLFLFSCDPRPQSNKQDAWVIDTLEIDSVWSGHSVDFDLVTDSPFQYVAYYDRDRHMTVAQRRLDERSWKKVRLPEVTGWDSHNYIAMVTDRKGYLHLSGNMHGDSLVYFLTVNPHDITSFQRVKELIGKEEGVVTYPQFLETEEGDLIFQYRVGESGKGNQIFNRYDPDTRKWSRLIDQPLVDGEGKMNAYLHGPVQGPDGYYHLIWVWRDTPDAATNHDLSYARSKNLIDWYRGNGEPQPIPITYENAEIVDAVPVEGGMINGNTKVGFDHKNRPVIAYHKFDEEGNTQLYNSRLEGGHWKIYQTTDWNFRWDFGGYGSLNSRVGVFPVKAEGDQLTQKYFIDSVGMQKILLDPVTLKETKKLPDDRPPYFSELEKVTADPNFVVHLKTDQPNARDTYVLRWETLPPRNDLPLETNIPDPQPLKLYHIRKEITP